jgi:hypothetical protein
MAVGPPTVSAQEEARGAMVVVAEEAGDRDVG